MSNDQCDYRRARFKKAANAPIKFEEFGMVMINDVIKIFSITPGGLEMEGVYRVNGGQLTMKKLRTSFDQGIKFV